MPWGPEGPPEEAYSRVTNPERYQVVVDRVRDLLDELETTYDVRTEVGSSDAWPARDDWPPADAEFVRLVPDDPGAGPLSVAFTDFPGVAVVAGRFSTRMAPECGCDACDERPSDLIDDITELVRSHVTGRLVEVVHWQGGPPDPLVPPGAGGRLVRLGSTRDLDAVERFFDAEQEFIDRCRNDPSFTPPAKLSSRRERLVASSIWGSGSMSGADAREVGFREPSITRWGAWPLRRT